MPDLNDVELESAERHEVLVDSSEMFARALETLELLIDGTIHASYPKVDYGNRSLKRDGDKRQVHYLEVTDPNGIVLRIEVFFK